MDQAPQHQLPKCVLSIRQRLLYGVFIPLALYGALGFSGYLYAINPKHHLFDGFLLFAFIYVSMPFAMGFMIHWSVSPRTSRWHAFVVGLLGGIAGMTCTTVLFALLKLLSD